jgi:hypothetical protein
MLATLAMVYGPLAAQSSLTAMRYPGTAHEIRFALYRVKILHRGMCLDIHSLSLAQYCRYYTASSSISIMSPVPLSTAV